MRPQVVSVTGVQTSAWIPVNRVKGPVNISLHVVPGAGGTLSVEYTVDDVFDPLVVPVAFPVTGMTAVVANTAGNIAFPVQAVRLAQTVGANTSRLTVLVADGAGG